MLIMGAQRKIRRAPTNFTTTPRRLAGRDCGPQLFHSFVSFERRLSFCRILLSLLRGHHRCSRPFGAPSPSSRWPPSSCFPARLRPVRAAGKSRESVDRPAPKPRPAKISPSRKRPSSSVPNTPECKPNRQVRRSNLDETRRDRIVSHPPSPPGDARNGTIAERCKFHTRQDSLG